MSIPAHLKFLESHEWIETGQNDAASVGISDHAQSELTDLVYVELPEPGREVEAGDPVAVVESVKAASDIYSPVSGEIVEVNPALAKTPGLVNEDAFGKGWLFKIKLNDPPELDGLLTPEAYQSLTGGDS